MVSYVVECFWPDIRPGQVEAAASRARSKAHELTGDGMRVVFTGSILVPDDEVVFYFFESASEEAVRQVCMRAEIEFERVLESIRSA